MAVTGLSKGSLYVHFKDKEDLALAVVKYNIQLLNDSVERALRDAADPPARLLAFLEVFADPMHPPVAGGCPLLNFGMEADDLYPAIRNEVDKALQAAQNRIAGIIRKGIAAGSFDSRWQPAEFATKMFALIEGGVMMSRVAGHNAKMKTVCKIIKQEIGNHLV